MLLIKNTHQDYHAHIYFDSSTVEFARQLRDQVKNTFELAVGRFNEKLVGPHMMWSFSITFTNNDFDSLIPWLEQQRNGHSVLVHAVTGDDFKDHTDYAYWLGSPVDINVAIFDS